MRNTFDALATARRHDGSGTNERNHDENQSHDGAHDASSVLLSWLKRTSRASYGRHENAIG
jgi:hypothetical protein